MGRNTKLLIVSLLGIAILIIGYIEVFGLSFEGKESDFYAPVVIGDNISTYKDSCIELNLSQVSKDPYSMIGKNVKITGQILKKEEFPEFGKTRTGIELYVPALAPDPYILVTYSDISEFEQGDNITVYGEYYYPAQDKSIPEIAEKYIPAIKASYIEKV